jgi:mono/diheme cytochrome c family protein
MRRVSHTIAALLLALSASAGSAQNGAGTRSSSSGVYTDAQAKRGQNTFAGMCTGCHTPATHTGLAFMNNWRGARLSELFVYLSDNMPKSDPGGLSPAEYVQLVAYILKLNRMPSGAQELPADTMVLRAIVLDTVAPGATTPFRTKRPG